MTADDGREIRDHVVATLPLLRPGAARAQRVQAQCRARLERDRRRSRQLASISRFGRHVAAPAIVAALVALYAADVLSITLRVFTA
jgi:hypothetical protein